MHYVGNESICDSSSLTQDLNFGICYIFININFIKIFFFYFKPVTSEVNAGQYLKENAQHKNNFNKGYKKSIQHDSGLDLFNCKDNDNKKNTNKNMRPRLESESSSDIDTNKNSMMFEMDM